jgi:hypothetical protein
VGKKEIRRERTVGKKRLLFVQTGTHFADIWHWLHCGAFAISPSVAKSYNMSDIAMATLWMP